MVSGNDIRNTVSRFTGVVLFLENKMFARYVRLLFKQRIPNKDASTIRALDGHGQEYYVILVQRRTFLEPF